MTSQATIGHGTLLKIYDGGYVTVEEIIDIDGPNREGSLIDVTNHDSASRYREFLQALRDGGNVTFVCNFLPSATNQGKLETAFDDGLKRQFSITWTDGPPATVWYFDALVLNIANTGANQDDQLQQNVTLKITGPVEFVEPSHA